MRLACFLLAAPSELFWMEFGWEWKNYEFFSLFAANTRSLSLSLNNRSIIILSLAYFEYIVLLVNFQPCMKNAEDMLVQKME